MSNIGIPTSPEIVVSNALTLVQRLAQECDVSDDPLNDIPTIRGTTGETARLVGWIITAWRDIQGLYRNWQFMRRTATFATVLNQSLYTPVQCGITPLTFGNWDRFSFRNWPTGNQNAEMFMGYLDYDSWRDLYQFGAFRTTPSRPFNITIDPSKSIGLGPVPLAGYTILGDYYMAPKDLASDTEVPTLPDWHNLMIIVYKAMMSYGAFEGASEVYDRGELEYKKLKIKLEMDQLLPVSQGGALS